MVRDWSGDGDFWPGEKFEGGGGISLQGSDWPTLETFLSIISIFHKATFCTVLE